VATVNDNGSVTQRWPWLIWGIDDWASPNGVKFLDRRKRFSDYPDAQPAFLRGTV